MEQMKLFLAGCTVHREIHSQSSYL